MSIPTPPPVLSVEDARSLLDHSRMHLEAHRPYKRSRDLEDEVVYNAALSVLYSRPESPIILDTQAGPVQYTFRRFSTPNEMDYEMEVINTFIRAAAQPGKTISPRRASRWRRLARNVIWDDDPWALISAHFRESHGRDFDAELKEIEEEL